MTKFVSFLRPHLASRQRQTGEHPDANLLLAFTERALSRREHTAVLAHLAECPECREILSLSSATSASETSQQVFSKASSTWWGWRLAATTAVLCLVTVTVWRLPLFQGSPAKATPPKPIIVSRPLPLAPAPVAPQTIEPNTAKAQTRLRGKQPFRRPVATEPYRSSTPSLANSSDEAKKSNKPLDVTAARAKAQAAPFGALRLQSGVAAPPATSQELLAPPNSRFSAVGGAAPAYNFLRVAPGNANTLWSLGASRSDGILQRSEDGGRTWRIIPVDRATRLYALSAAGADVWVGGADGKLFHSADEGEHWTAIPVADDDTSLAGWIVGIDALGQSITLKTNSGATWTTDDGGAHWRRQ
jgi:hypothetical protein